MLEYTTLKKKRRDFLALTGLTPKEFEILLPAFRRAYERKHPPNKTLAGQKRKREIGGGRQGGLSGLEQKLLFGLVYLKTYPLQVVQGVMFGISQSRANHWAHQLLPLLEQALDDCGVLPERDPSQFARHEKRQGEPNDLTIDGTERRRQRPKKPEKQGEYYSGKKKAHSDKNVIVTNTKTKRVGYLSPTYPGKTHDKKIADQQRLKYPRQAKLRKDSAFQGYEPAVQQTYQPKKSHRKAN